MAPSYIEAAALSVQARQRIRSAIYETPLIPARTVGATEGSKILFKCENFQLTGSFKIRGATSKISAAGDGVRLITASSGNHGIGSACAAQKLSKDVTVVVPESVSPMKLKKIQAYRVKVIIHGAECGLSEQYAQGLALKDGYTYISPYNDIDVIAGQGTIGLEILEQCTNVDNVFITLGGGGLVSGIGSVIKAFSPSTKIYGVSATNSKALAESIRAGRVVETEHLDTICEAVAGGIDFDTITLPLAMAVIDELIDCSEEEVKQALYTLALNEGMVVEGSAALALAGYQKVVAQVAGQTSVLLLCGGNVDSSRVVEILNSK